jgi:predicted transcriptional regulator
MDDPHHIALTADIVSAYVENNKVAATDVPALIQSVHQALAGATQPESAARPERTKLTPAQIRKSITPDALISFVDGKPYKTIKRHLATHGMTLAEYKERFGLPADYPSAAANYSAARSQMAKALGLGQMRKGSKATQPS